jgi:hopanoid-associated phosphorylase
MAAGPGIKVMCGSAQRYVKQLEATVAQGGNGIISIGIAGGLAPGLAPGDWVVASGVVANGTRYATDSRWAHALRRALPTAVFADISGVDAPVVDKDAKREMYETSRTVAVDMESHIAGKVAAAHGVPFAACRVIIDPAERTLPPAALVGMRADGTPDALAVLWSVVRQPWQVPALIRVIADARAARVALFRGRTSLGADLGFPGLGEAQPKFS